ncbi:MAG: amidohydrolase [Betaproteobacteria bacterium]|nr:MAG: amidohydrolase [Betaproteobacteria bacterium]
MPSKEDLKRQVCESIERRADALIGIGETIRHQPELGFKEFKTAALVAKTFEEIKVPHRTGLACTGVKAELNGAKAGPTLALIGELDALVVSGHPLADPLTGAAHACGHNAQVTAVLGATWGLVDTGAMRHLAGRIVPFAVPAEEYGDIAWRLEQVRAGQLEFLGGKPELIRHGHFDDVDMALLIHTSSRAEDKSAGVAVSNNGCVVKTVRYIGRAAHAGSSPHLGINALYAANLALSAINALRETFQERDTIRVHPVITQGGRQVNVIPGEVHLETYVRGKSVEAIMDANAKVDRALRAGALAMGAQVEITTLPGYMPLSNHPELAKVFRRNAEALVGAERYAVQGHRTGSTDMGDISQIMPAVQGYMSGASGTGHGADFMITDTRFAYVAQAQVLATTAIDLLYGDAEAAREVLRDYKAPMTRAQYLAFQRGINKTEVFDGAA